MIDSMPNSTRTLRVLISAYACEPGKGSEPGTGWNMVCQLAGLHHVTVVTRANNRPAIEAALATAPIDSLHFVYYDPCKLLLVLKKSGLLSTQLFYFLWQLGLSRAVRRMFGPVDFDIVHHLTFNSFEIPPFIFSYFHAQSVFGPVGGGQLAPGSLTATLDAKSKIMEGCRGTRRLLALKNSCLRSILRKCSLVLFANEETAGLLGPFCPGKTGVMIDVGVDPSQFSPATAPGSGERLLFAGNFQPRKGTRLLLLAFEAALIKNPRLHLTMVGNGELLDREKAWVASKGLTSNVEFAGRINHTRMTGEFAKAGIFVFPSLRDTSGAIVLEAMSSGLPTVCLDHQGAALMVDSGSGIKVPVSSLHGTVQSLAEAILDLSADETMRSNIGTHARQRTIDRFSWTVKAREMTDFYRSIVGGI